MYTRALRWVWEVVGWSGVSFFFLHFKRFDLQPYFCFPLIYLLRVPANLVGRARSTWYPLGLSNSLTPCVLSDPFIAFTIMSRVRKQMVCYIWLSLLTICSRECTHIQYVQVHGKKKYIWHGLSNNNKKVYPHTVTRSCCSEWFIKCSQCFDRNVRNQPQLGTSGVFHYACASAPNNDIRYRHRYCYWGFYRLNQLKLK